MTRVLQFPDPLALTDLGTYAGRAAAVDDHGAIRLHAHGSVLAAYVSVLPGHGLLGEGAVIGLRVMPLAGSTQPPDLDVTLPLTVVVELLAKADGQHAELTLPEADVVAGWAALTPPRAGWELVGSVPSEELRAAATGGIQEVAQGTSATAGAHAVTALRQAVWGRETPTVPPVPAGAAFAAYVLGFLRDQQAQVFASGRWTRLSTSTGHVLVR